MEFKRKQSVLRKRFWFRFIVCIAALLGSFLYLTPGQKSDVWTVIIGVCGSALVWALVELVDFFVQTHYQYESERNTYIGMLTEYFCKMKSIIRANKDSIPMHELRVVVDELYEETNRYVFNSNIYPVSKEFEMCANYIQRMYWKFDACCMGIYDDCEEKDEYYKKLYDSILLAKEEKEVTSGRLFRSFFAQKSEADMTDIELSFEAYQLPKNLVSDDVKGNIEDKFTVPGNIRKTITFIPDIAFGRFYKNSKSSVFSVCMGLLFRKIQDVDDACTDEKKESAKNRKALNSTKFHKLFKKITGFLMVMASAYFSVVYLLLAFGSTIKLETFTVPFAYVSFALSLLFFLLSAIKAIKNYAKNNRAYCLIIAIFLSFGYVALRVQFWPDIVQYEDIGTALTVLASYVLTVFERQSHIIKENTTEGVK